MAEASISSGTHGDAARGLLWRIAWRNLWRNPRRTWLTAGGIAFACLLVTFSMALQGGGYAAMIESGTNFLTGQIQIQHPLYGEEQKLEQTVVNAQALLAQVQDVPNLRVAPRAEAFALVSAGERSFGGLVTGVDFAAEQQIVTFFQSLSAGALPVAPDDALIGEILARNLGAQVGDEVVVLGTAAEGGVAAMALRISGIFSSGQAEIDRSMMFTHLAAVQEAFALGDAVHRLVIGVTDLEDVPQQVRALKEVVVASPGAVVRPWQETLPDLVQAIELDRVSAQFMYGAIIVLVSFSVINTFLMIAFERTREFGMLLAIGMRPASIMGQILIEALSMWLVGTVAGLALSSIFVGYLALEGLNLAAMEEMAQMAQDFYITGAIYPKITFAAMATAPLILLVGTQIAGLVASVRVRHIQPVVALRAE